MCHDLSYTRRFSVKQCLLGKLLEAGTPHIQWLNHTRDYFVAAEVGYRLDANYSIARNVYSYHRMSGKHFLRSQM